MYLLERQMLVNASIQKCWRFFSDPQNLAVITPKDMRFNVRSTGLPDEIYSGLLINYTVSPLYGIALNWTTVIKEVDPLSFFADEQLKGPFKHWRHEHYFEERNGQTFMRDKVFYQLPLSILGKLAKGIVSSRLEYIFNYRTEAIENHFPH